MSAVEEADVRTPLLRSNHSAQDSYTQDATTREVSVDNDEVPREGRCVRCVPTKGFCEELKETWLLSWPLMVITTSNFALQPVAIMFGGHLGKQELDALALSNSIINIVGWCTLLGFGSVCDTLFSQTFGSKNMHLMGIYLQRCLVLHLLLVMILVPLFANMGPVLMYTGQDPEVSRLAGQYLLMFIPGLVAMCFYFVIREYIYTQNIVMPDLVISLSALVIHVPLQYSLIHVAGWGLMGSAVGQVVVLVYMCLSTVIYFLASGLYKATWSGWYKAALQDWWPIAKLGTYGLLLNCFEWWAFEITLYLSGILGGTQLAAQSIVFNLDVMLYSVAGALSIATGIRVGWNLGANRPRSAVTSSSAGMALSLCAAMVTIIIVLSAHRELPKLFTSDDDVIHLASNLLPFIAAYTLFDSISGVGRAVIRGTGMQKIGTIMVFICYYVMALPISLPLMFLTKYQLYGVWASFTFSLALGGVAYIIIIYFVFDWTKLAREAQVRSGVLDQTPSEDQPEAEAASQERRPVVLSDTSGINSTTDSSSEDNSVQTVTVPLTCSEIAVKTLIALIITIGMVAGVALHFVVHVDYHRPHHNQTISTTEPTGTTAAGG